MIKIAENKVYNEDVKLQIYKIIRKFTVVKESLHNVLNTEEEFNDFVMYAYTYYLDKIYPVFDASKATLSTHVVTTLKYLTPVFIVMVKHGVDFSTARRMVNKRDEHLQQACKVIYDTRSLDTCLDGLENIDPSIEKDVSSNIALCDDTYEPFNYLYESCGEQDIEKIKNSDLGRKLNYYINKYLDGKKVKDKEQRERNTDIIWRMCFRFDLHDTNLSKLGEKWGISRERVRQIFKSFTSWAKRNKKFKKDILEIM